MLNRFNQTHVSPLSALYDEARLPQIIRRSLNLILLGNLFGGLHGIICGGGTTAMIGLANELNAGDLAFGVINGIPQAAALLQIPYLAWVLFAGYLNFGVWLLNR